MNNKVSFLLAAIAAAVAAPAQDAPGLAIVNARLLPIAGPPIARGTMLLRDGKIEQLGPDIKVPAGYRVVDAAGGTVMPGIVSAHAHTGLTQAAPDTGERPNRFRRGGGRRRGGRGGGPVGNAEDKTAEKVLDRIYARQEVYEDVLRDGVTTLGLAPLGRGLPGQGAVVRPAGDDVAAMTIAASAFVAFAPMADTKTKDLIRKAIEDGKRALERRQRRAAAREEAAAQELAERDKPAGEGQEKAEPQPKEGGKEPDPAKPTPPGNEERPGAGGDGSRGRGQRPQPETDPGAEVMADLIEGKTRAFVQLDSATDFVHWEDVSQDTTFETVFVARRHATSSNEGSLELVVERIKKRKCTVLLSPDFDVVPNTQYLVNVAARLHAAGVPIGFLLPDQGRPLQAIRPQLMELVRAGLPEDVALAGVTLTPAKALGVDKLVGSLAVGKAANLLLWSADPLDPVAELRGVWLDGHEVEDTTR